MSIVAIVGKAGSGKDTIANHLTQEHGFAQIALADPLKRYAQKVFRFSEDQLWGPSHLRNEEDVRFGVDAHDILDSSDAWVATFARAKAFNATWVREVLPSSGLLIDMATHNLGTWLSDLRESKEPLSPRSVLQSLGTEWGRALRDTIWLDHCLLVAGKIQQGSFTYMKTKGPQYDPTVTGTPVVISDVRFANELEAIKNAKGYLIKVNRPNAGLEVSFAQHASEQEQEGFDDEMFNLIVNNNSTIENLLHTVDLAATVITRPSNRPLKF